MGRGGFCLLFRPEGQAMECMRMESLKGQFLVAMPEMGDDRFKDTVIYLVGHGDEGAMGLVVNQSLEDMRFADILEELGIGEKDDIIQLPDDVKSRQVLRGGPVQRGRGEAEQNDGGWNTHPLRIEHQT